MVSLQSYQHNKTRARGQSLVTPTPNSGSQSHFACDKNAPPPVIFPGHANFNTALKYVHINKRVVWTCHLMQLWQVLTVRTNHWWSREL